MGWRLMSRCIAYRSKEITGYQMTILHNEIVIQHRAMERKPLAGALAAWLMKWVATRSKLEVSIDNGEVQ